MDFPKLAYAVLGGHVHALIQSGTVSLARMIPALRKIADQAPDYGAGLTAEGLKGRFGKGLAGAPRAGLETWQHGASKLEIAQGHVARASDAFYNHIGTLTEALQTEGKLNKATEARVASYPACAGFTSNSV
jgi:hypothetical protein